jgi:transposase-like protein
MIDSVISTGVARFGVYRNCPQPAIPTLSDIRVLAQRVLTFSGREDLREHLPPHSPLPVEEPEVQVGSRYVRRKSVGADRPTTAVTTAAGVVAALDIVRGATIDDAGSRLHWVIECCRRAGVSTSPTAVLHWGARTTEVLDGVRLAAVGPQMLLSDQLRFRTVTGLPRRTSRTRSAELNRHTPSMLWPRWAQPLTVPGSRRLHHRLALAAAIQIIGTDQTPSEACARLGGHLRPGEMHRVLKLFHSERMWLESGTALVRMADFLADHGAPIDYARRRGLDYKDLLPDDEWRRIYRRSDAPAIGKRTTVAARMFLYELISGQPAARPSGRVAFKLFSFPRCLTPNLLTALNEHGMEFLADQGIADEPVAWDPPASVFDGLCLPGADIDSIDRVRLFDLLRKERKEQRRRSMSEVARTLGTTNDILYDHLSSRPLPPRPPESEYLLKAQRHHFRAAREKLPRERLTAMYRDEGLSIRTIATRTELSRHTVRDLVDEYGIGAPVAPTRNPINVDPDWVKAQYLSELRTFPDIAAEIGVSAAGLTRWARRRNIRRRGRGSHNHSAALNAQRRARSSPPLLKAAVAQPGGWERLQRFRRVVTLSSFDLAAESIGTTPCTLSRQIGRLERETGGTLIQRATRARPMTVTEHGLTVLQAISELEKISAA